MSDHKGKESSFRKGQSKGSSEQKQAAPSSRVDKAELCYQCCKRVPIDELAQRRHKKCSGRKQCGLASSRGLAHIPMPQAAAAACDEFTALLLAYYAKLDNGADADIVEMVKGNVLAVRRRISEVNAPAPAARK